MSPEVAIVIAVAVALLPFMACWATGVIRLRSDRKRSKLSSIAHQIQGPYRRRKR